MLHILVKVANPKALYFLFIVGKVKITDLFYSKNKEVTMKAMLMSSQLQEKVS